MCEGHERYYQACKRWDVNKQREPTCRQGARYNKNPPNRWVF
jgi:hypothetical protein